MEYNLLETKLTVMHWVKAHIDKLQEEKIGSRIQIKQDNFKATIKQCNAEVTGPTIT